MRRDDLLYVGHMLDMAKTVQQLIAGTSRVDPLIAYLTPLLP